METETGTVEQSGENPFVAKFESFFRNNYLKNIEKLVEHYPEKRSLEIDFKDLEHFDYELADELLVNPDYVLEAASLALENMDVPALELKDFRPHIRFFNLPKDSMPILRDISSGHLNKMIAVEGVIKMMTEVLPRLKTATWECRRCGNTYKIVQGSANVRLPAICECKHKDFKLKEEQSEFVDFQKIEVQEPLELLKGSEQATNLNIYVTDDLVNKLTPGARTVFTGVLRLYVIKDKEVVYGRYLEAIHLEETARGFENVEISKEEEAQIKELAGRKDIYDMLVKSIAPTIYGHEVVKEAIALQLFGGVHKVLPGDNKIRGNIHVMLVGDPGLAKSALLQAVNKIAPKSIYIAGKTSSGAGISATAVKDDFGEGGWTLKAGALVLASGGLCMIDELDKMDDEDRSALHESLEQQTISVAKAGIVTRFKTETSVLAAANPKFARFDQHVNFIEQVALPVTLISRFDLLFLIRDVLDRKKDEAITSHILRTHQAGEMLLQEKTGTRKMSETEKETIEKLVVPVIDAEILKKYISYARQNIFPILSGEAIDGITSFYLELREMGRKDGNVTATHRQLEGLVRMSEASAKVRLSNVVGKEDSDRAIRLLKTSLQETVTDVETGKIDIDLITSGVSHTQMTNLKKVLNIIKQKAMESNKAVPKQDIIDEAKVEGIDRDKCMEIIGKLQKAGDIYEPSHGLYKPTQKM